MIISTEGLYPFHAFTIPDKFVKKAKDELFETDENRDSALQRLRELVLDETDLRCRITDEFLIKFLRARKFNIPKALSLVKKHMGFKKKNQDIFTGMDFEVLSKLIKKKVFGFLPYRCKDGCAVLVVQLDNWNPSQFSIKDICKAVVIFLYHSICDPLTQINGYKIIFDVKSRGIKHIRFCTPGNLYLLYTGTQECFPGRFKEIHILNMSTTFQLAWAVISPFLSEKLKKRMVLENTSHLLTNTFKRGI
ncbi:clavesin-2 [Nephila pilipes]|uniref:Clavesin-2 n=1 Tax=Nephila pilipes TaxID=299642 RepID=A0A8X6QD10_NEPPI|nr:clavesin-2 [Nephila pilipes]